MWVRIPPRAPTIAGPCPAFFLPAFVGSNQGIDPRRLRRDSPDIRLGSETFIPPHPSWISEKGIWLRYNGLILTSILIRNLIVCSFVQDIGSWVLFVWNLSSINFWLMLETTKPMSLLTFFALVSSGRLFRAGCRGGRGRCGCLGGGGLVCRV